MILRYMDRLLRTKDDGHKAKHHLHHGFYDNSKAIKGAMAWTLVVIACLCSYTLFMMFSDSPCSPFSVIKKGISRVQIASPSPEMIAADIEFENSSRSKRTSLSNIVFGIGASATILANRTDYIRSWWRQQDMRGFIWVESKVENWSQTLPPVMISEDTSRFKYTHKTGTRSAIRISRIVSEMVRLGLKDVHWFVMGDDDTVFVPENLVQILSKYDYHKPYYIGSTSESHTQSVIMFNSNMAYGGGGFAISYPLARALEKMQDDCLQRYPYLYGSDDRIHACISELGVPLIREPGFHQLDILGDAFGILTAHPITPLISLHHLSVIDPFFPNKTQAQSLRHMSKAIEVDPGGALQQSICYDKRLRWSIGVSWGYAIQISRQRLLPRQIELPTRTFRSWYGDQEMESFTFKTRPISSRACGQSVVFYMKSVSRTSETTSWSEYVRDSKPNDCSIEDSLAVLKKIQVVKEKTDKSWYQAPRRQCCRITNSRLQRLDLEIGDCREGEIIA